MPVCVSLHLVVAIFLFFISWEVCSHLAVSVIMIGATFGFRFSSVFVFVAGQVSMFDCCWLFLLPCFMFAFDEVSLSKLVCSWVWCSLLSSVSMSVVDKASNLFCVAIVGFCPMFIRRFLWVSVGGRFVLSVGTVGIVFGEL